MVAVGEHRATVGINIKMLEEEIIKKYGKRLWNKIKKSEMIRGITITITKDGKEDFPERDIELAIKDLKGEYIHPFEWD